PSATTGSPRPNTAATMAPSSSSLSLAPPQGVREWWLRTALVLQAPRPVFAALRDEGEEAVGNRSEPVLLVVLLAGMAGMLMTAAAGRLLDNPNFDGVLVAIWVFIGGGADGIAGYWLFGALLYAALKLFGSRG